MRQMSKVFLAFTLLCALFSTGLSKAWNGIVPLKSTRMDVEKLFGKGSEAYQGTFDYKLSKQKLSVTYSSGSCKESSDAEWDVPKDTVLSMVISSRKTVFLDDIPEDLALFEKLPGDYDLPGTFNYLNEKDGMSMAVETRSGHGKDTVNTFFYFPTAAERHLKCSKTSRK